MTTNPRPPTHVVTYTGSHRSGRFTAYDAADAARVAAAFEAAGFAVDGPHPVAQPAIQQTLAEEEVAA